MSKLCRPVAAAVAMAGAAVIAFATPAASQSSAPRFSYTEAQADIGRSVYSGFCASCHGADLDSAEGFIRDVFLSWSSSSLGDLFNFIKELMPLDDIGIMEDQQVADILAHIARVNGVQPGDTPVPADLAILRQIRFPSP